MRSLLAGMILLVLVGSAHAQEPPVFSIEPARDSAPHPETTADPVFGYCVLSLVIGLFVAALPIGILVREEAEMMRADEEAEEHHEETTPHH